jgi:hypothetical protein
MSARAIATSEWYAAQSSAVEPSRDGSLTFARLAISARTAWTLPSLAAATTGFSPAASPQPVESTVTSDSNDIHRNPEVRWVRILAPPVTT